MFTLTKNILGRRTRDFLLLNKFGFARDVGDLSQLKKFKARSKHDDMGISTFFGEDTSILIQQPMETLLSCLSNCELKSILYWAKENNVSIERLEIYTDAYYDSRNYFKNSDGRDITGKVNDKESKDEQKEGQKKEQPKKEEQKKEEKGSTKGSEQKYQNGKMKEEAKETKVEKDSKEKQTVDKYRNKNNMYEEVNINITIKTSEKDKNKVMEILKKGQETCPVHTMLDKAGIKLNSKINIL
jgi:uncharacterized OsmC-like protein